VADAGGCTIPGAGGVNMVGTQNVAQLLKNRALPGFLFAYLFVHDIISFAAGDTDAGSQNPLNLVR